MVSIVFVLHKPITVCTYKTGRRYFLEKTIAGTELCIIYLGPDELTHQLPAWGPQLAAGEWPGNVEAHEVQPVTYIKTMVTDISQK